MDIYQNSLIEAIEIQMEEYIKNLKLDYTIEGKILSIEGNAYTVLYNGEEITTKAREGLVLETNDIVYIRVIQGNFSDKFIDCKKP